MIKVYYIEEDYPLAKDIVQIAAMVAAGEVIVFPTDTVYAIGCSINNKHGIDKLLTITNKMDKKTKLSILCKDIKTISEYTVPYSTQVFRTIKEYSPGPVTFILNANQVMSRLFKANKSEIGVRIPGNEILKMLLSQLEYPMISTSLNLGSAENRNDPDYILDQIKHQADIMIHTQLEHAMESTIIDCTGQEIEVIREGKTII